MYVLAFGAKIGTFFEGGCPLHNPLEKILSVSEKNQNLFLHLTPNFYNLKEPQELRFGKKTELKRLRIDQIIKV